MRARRHRVARGGAATVVGVLLAAVSHTFGGGSAPGPWTVLVAALLTWPVAVLFAARRPRLLGAAVGALWAQATLHTLAALTVGATGTVHVAHHGVIGLGPAGGIVPPEPGMLAAHLAAAVAALTVIGCGTRVLRAIARGLGGAVRRATVRPRPRPAPRLHVAVACALPAPAAWTRTRHGRAPPPLLSR